MDQEFFTQDGSMAAVSYTHLDVYKRQAHKQIQSVVDKMRVDLQKKNLKLHILISGFLLDVFLHQRVYLLQGSVELHTDFPDFIRLVLSLIHI